MLLIYFFPKRDISDQACETSWAGLCKKKMTLAKCDQQVVNHQCKDWLCCWNLIAFIEMRDLQALFNLILLPGRLTYSWCVKCHFPDDFLSCYKVWLWPLQSAGSSPYLVFETLILSFPSLLAPSTHLFQVFYSRKINSSLLSFMSLWKYVQPCSDNFDWDWEKA